MTAALRRVLEPSLARRVVAALLWAFLLVWCALVGIDYVSFKVAALDRQALRAAAQVLADSLNDAGDAEAALIVKATESQFNRSRRDLELDGIGELMFSLDVPDAGKVLYASRGLRGWTPPPDAGAGQPIPIAGQTYGLVRIETARWRLLVLEPVVSDGSLLRWLGRQQLQPMLLAFPLVLLPLVWAVRRGLLPLRDLAAHIASRDASDVSPLGMDLRYAELRPLVVAFDQLLARARQGIARERAFVQDAAHELRTPLAVVTAQAHALVGTSGPDARHEAKSALERAVARASHLVHQLLTLARVEGGSPHRARPVDLVEVTRQVLIAAAPAAAGRRMEVSLDSPDSLAVTIDVESFHSIVDNLVRNALAYCPPGARVEVQLTVQDPRVRLAVRDDGPGIAAGDVLQLFERFHRGRDAPSPGSGLGLAIVRHAAQALGGSVALQSGIDGRGAGFVVEFAVDETPRRRSGTA